MVARQQNPRRQFPKGVVIRRIRRGEGYRDQWIYAELVDRDGNLLISATLDYICDELERGAFTETV
jgi:hypothetical protein